jgi:hypothetical protein
MTQYIINFLNTLQGLRKTMVMLSLILLGAVFRVKGYISGDNMVDLLKGTVIAFFSANGLEHITTTVKEYINAKGKKVEENVVSVSEKEEN